MNEVFIIAVVFTAVFIGVGIFRRWSLRRNLLDVPNERSSHTEPTPRGGGLIIVVVCLNVYLWLAWAAGFQGFSWSYPLGAAMIAAVSWFDDLYSMRVVGRFAVHTTAAALVVYELIYLKITAATGVGFLTSENLIFALIVFGIIIWLTNAYNFMDGIDGIAATQAVTAGIGWFFVGRMLGDEATALYGAVIAAAAFGFLLHNWEKAKIFMGDVGSAFLGFSFAVLPLSAFGKTAAENTKTGAANLILIGIFLIWLFIFDTLYTFFRRLLRGEKVWQAHRSHVYQKMVIAGVSHQTVTLFYGGVSAFNVLLIGGLLRRLDAGIYLAAAALIEAAVLIYISYNPKGLFRPKKTEK